MPSDSRKSASIWICLRRSIATSRGRRILYFKSLSFMITLGSCTPVTVYGQLLYVHMVSSYSHFYWPIQCVWPHDMSPRSKEASSPIWLNSIELAFPMTDAMAASLGWGLLSNIDRLNSPGLTLLQERKHVHATSTRKGKYCYGLQQFLLTRRSICDRVCFASSKTQTSARRRCTWPSARCAEALRCGSPRTIYKTGQVSSGSCSLL